LATKEKLLSATDRELKSLQAKYNDALTRANNAEAELKLLKPEHARDECYKTFFMFVLDQCLE
jgi:hypothetical protein